MLYSVFNRDIYLLNDKRKGVLYSVMYIECFGHRGRSFDMPKFVLQMEDYPSLMQPVIDLVQVKVLFALSKPV